MWLRTCRTQAHMLIMGTTGLGQGRDRFVTVATGRESQKPGALLVFDFPDLSRLSRPCHSTFPTLSQSLNAWIQFTLIMAGKALRLVYQW